jgi:hypothetical protein
VAGPRAFHRGIGGWVSRPAFSCHAGYEYEAYSD